MVKKAKKTDSKKEKISQPNNYRKTKDLNYYDNAEDFQKMSDATVLKKRKARRIFLAIFFGFSLIGPPWLGRQLAFLSGKQILEFLNLPNFIFNLIGFIPVILFIISLLLAYYERKNYIFHSIGYLCLILFIAEFCFLKNNFYYPNYVVYLEQANKANSVDIGILIGFLGALLFLIYFIVLLVTTKPGSRIGRLANGKYLIITFLVIEFFVLICSVMFHFINFAF